MEKLYSAPLAPRFFHTGTIGGKPAAHLDDDETLAHLADLMGYFKSKQPSKSILLLLFTDGKGFHRPPNAFALERLARWPMMVWLDLRAPRFWDESLNLALKHKLPVYPANKDGIMQAVAHFMTERGTHGPTVAIGGALPDLADIPAAAWVEYVLADALPLMNLFHYSFLSLEIRFFEKACPRSVLAGIGFL